MAKKAATRQLKVVRCVLVVIMIFTLGPIIAAIVVPWRLDWSTPQCIEHNQISNCFEPSHAVCKSRSTRRAILTAYDFTKPLTLNNAHGKGHGRQSTARVLANLVQAAKVNEADILLMKPDKAKVEDDVRVALERLGITMVEVPWAVPPQLSAAVPRESGGCCGAREFLKLHAFNLTIYDAVILYDTDVRLNEKAMKLNASLSPIFDCAASGYFLTTSTSLGFPWVNGGFFAVRPNEALFNAMLTSLETATVSQRGGWNGQGWGPFNIGVHATEFRMQGFLTYFFYQSRLHEPYVVAKQIDGCIWNRQKWHTLGACNAGSAERCMEETMLFHHTGCDPVTADDEWRYVEHMLNLYMPGVVLRQPKGALL